MCDEREAGEGEIGDGERREGYRLGRKDPGFSGSLAGGADLNRTQGGGREGETALCSVTV